MGPPSEWKTTSSSWPMESPKVLRQDALGASWWHDRVWVAFGDRSGGFVAPWANVGVCVAIADAVGGDLCWLDRLSSSRWNRCIAVAIERRRQNGLRRRVVCREPAPQRQRGLCGRESAGPVAGRNPTGFGMYHCGKQRSFFQGYWQKVWGMMTRAARPITGRKRARGRVDYELRVDP